MKAGPGESSGMLDDLQLIALEYSNYRANQLVAHSIKTVRTVGMKPSARMIRTQVLSRNGSRQPKLVGAVKAEVCTSVVSPMPMYDLG